MKTSKLIVLLLSICLISFSCSNESLDLSTEEKAIESDLFERGGVPTLSQSLITVDNVDFIFNVSTAKGKTRVSFIIDSSSSPYALGKVGQLQSGACRDYEGNDTVSLELSLTPQLKKNEINGQSYSGCVSLVGGGTYGFSVTLDSKKQFTTAASQIFTPCCL